MKTVASIPLVRPGMANCLACVKSNLRGGMNTCPVKELRDHLDPARSYMARSRDGEQFECGSFKPLGLAQTQHRLGVDLEKHREQESLF